MSKNQFVRDRRFFSRISSGDTQFPIITRILIVVFILAIISGAIYAGIFAFSKYSIEKSYEEFITECDKKEFSKAVSIYRSVQEKTLTKSIFIFHQDERKTTLLKMEEKVDQLIEIPFNALIISQTSFSSDDLILMKEFQELSSRKISVLTNTYIEEFILGLQPKESVQKTFTELKKVEALADMVSRYESSLDQMIAFSPTMILINNEYKEKNYLPAATKLKTEIEKQSGFIKEYLNRYYLNCKNVMYPVLKSDIDVMMTGSKYYSAKSLIEQLILFFPKDTYLEQQLLLCDGKVTKKLVEYTLPVEHLAIRPLIATPALAFDNDNYSKNAEDLMLTVNEFRKILDQLYQKNYILIDINTLVNSAGQKNRLFYPEGKKPIILTIEGLNYYAGRSRSGNSDNLLFDANGNVASSYKNENGMAVIDRDGEAIGILEQFIEAHPDFSFDGSKGNISLTGFECIFGYVTNEDQVDDRTKAFVDNQLSPFTITPAEIASNKKKVVAIITKLKNNGWSFSSSTYGNILVADATLEQLQKDTDKWIEQVGSLIGNTKTFLFPSGSIVSSKDPKGSYLVGKGFLIHSGIGPWAYFNFSGTNLYMDRISLNGLALRFQNLSRFFDVKTIYEPTRINKLN